MSNGSSSKEVIGFQVLMALIKKIEMRCFEFELHALVRKCQESRTRLSKIRKIYSFDIKEK